MAELSSNWKKLQATLQGDNPVKTSSLKRKSENGTSLSDATQSHLEKRRRKSYQQPAVSEPSPRMGGVQSLEVRSRMSEDQRSSLRLWSGLDGTTSESLAEAYDLGMKETYLSSKSLSDRVNHGLTPTLDIGKYIAVDCEMVGVGPGGRESALARVSLVDFHGRQIYDSFVRPVERVTNWRSDVSGVSPKEMKFARDFDEVQRDISQVIEGRILIGHDIKHDLEALKLSHPSKDIRDTATHQPFRKFGHGRKPALRTLAQELLGVDIQQGSHSSTEDARVTMLLFRKDKTAFDVNHANRYHPTVLAGPKRQPKKHSKRRKHKS